MSDEKAFADLDHVVINNDDIRTNAPAVAEAVKENRRVYMKAQTFRDTDGVMECWLPSSSILLPPGQPTVVGWEEVKAWYAEQLAITVMALEVQYEEILAADPDPEKEGNWAFARASYTGVFFIENTETGEMETIKDTGKILESHERADDGTWRFTTHMWSSDIASAVNAQAH